ncbi:hypothetical protein RJ639_022032 [Escallonia herrerae]|uniref:non-specific serine/threonine protein kinase n=1 Tax=Escallonia herrerae TaxID=1293975 RepID=A0AA88V5T5_9ASTE|nr:hypothetical protein RJ639_022032 [Escallonia herrerae]
MKWLPCGALVHGLAVEHGVNGSMCVDNALLDVLTFLNPAILKILLPTGISILIHAFFVELVQSADWEYEACRPRNCTSGPNIGYPFYIEDDKNDTSVCGYPSFNVACENDKPLYATSCRNYIVEDIFYEEHSIRLVNAENYPHNLIAYASNATPRSYAVLNAGKDKMNFSAMPCESYVAAPVELEGGRDNQTERIDYTKLLKNGFTLERSAAISCTECEKTGGYCGYNHTEEVYFCCDGDYSKRCSNGRLPNSS